MEFIRRLCKRYIDRGRIEDGLSKKAEVKQILGTMKEDDGNPRKGLRRLGCKFWKALDERRVSRADEILFGIYRDVKPIQYAVKAGVYSRGRWVDGTLWWNRA